MPEITINIRRIDWPCYRTFDCTGDELILCQFRELYPDLFTNSKILFVGQKERWIRLEDDAILDPNALYRLVSVVDENVLNQQPQRCRICDRLETSVSTLRYHSGKLLSQQWVHGMTICWEWSCCSRVVQHSQIENHDATTGCNVGKCSACRDLSEYQQAISKREQEVKDAFS